MDNRMDKELIKMCSDERIQSKWVPEYGHAVICRGRLGHIINLDPGERSFHVMGHGLPIHCWEYVDNGDTIFIPSIEIVLEWIDKKIRYSGGEGWSARHIDPENAQQYWFFSDTFIKVALKVFMYFEYSVQWKGKAWTN